MVSGGRRGRGGKEREKREGEREEGRRERGGRGGKERERREGEEREGAVDHTRELMCTLLLPKLQVIELFGPGCSAIARDHLHFNPVNHLGVIKTQTSAYAPLRTHTWGLTI